MCARLPGRVRRPGRPALPRAAERLPGLRAVADAAGSRRLAGAARTTRSISRSAALASGAVVAVKGVGGYHLACRADDEDAVAALRAASTARRSRSRCSRADVAAARALADVSARRRGAAVVTRAADRARCRAVPDARVAAAVAPGLAGPRRDAALLAAPPPARTRLRRAARADERQPQRRADRLPRRGRARAARPGSRTCSWSTTGRSRRAPTTRSCGPSSSAAGGAR